MRFGRLLVVSMALISSLIVLADGKKKKIDKNKWDPYNCCHNMADTPHMPVVLTEHFLIPEFYFYDTVFRADSAFVCEIFDGRDSVINPDTLHDFGNARFISIFKYYIDHAHTYRDNDGKQQPLPVVNMVQRYQRLGKEKWMSIGYPGNKYSELREYRDNIVRTDTFINSNPAHTVTMVSICRYYKVAEVKK